MRTTWTGSESSLYYSGDAMETLSAAKDIITEEFRKGGLNALHILLFGSRARGDFDNRSDWDFFVTADKDLSQ